MVLFIVTMVTQLATLIEDPIRDYLNNPRNWEGWEHEITTIETFRGDISGDGIDDVFVRSAGDPDQHGVKAWEVYESSDDAYIRLGRVDLYLFYSFLGNMDRVEGERGAVPAFKHRLLTTSGGGDGKPYLIFWTYIENHRVIQEKGAELYLSNFDSELVNTLFGSRPVQVRTIDKVEYLNRSTSVSPPNPGRSPRVAAVPKPENESQPLASSDSARPDQLSESPTSNESNSDRDTRFWVLLGIGVVGLAVIALLFIYRKHAKM